MAEILITLGNLTPESKDPKPSLAINSIGAMGVTFPAMHVMIAKWAPPNELSRTVVFSYSGATSGTIITLPIVSLLCDSNFLGGWPSAFYVFGIVGIIWFFAWGKLVASSPEDHRSISKEEREYIRQSHQISTAPNKTTKVPWLHIFTSIRVWAIVVAHFSNNWIWILALTGLPSYFRDVMQFNFKKMGFLSSLPFLVGFIGFISGGIFADFLIKKDVSITRARKLIATLGFYPGAGFLVLAGYSPPDNHVLPVTFMIVAIGFLCLNHAGHHANHLDIAPNFGSVLLGITTTAGTLSGCVAPLVTGYFTEKLPSRENYQKVFLIAGCIATLGGTFFIIFATGERQKWNEATNIHSNVVTPAASACGVGTRDECTMEDMT